MAHEQQHEQHAFDGREKPGQTDRRLTWQPYAKADVERHEGKQRSSGRPT
jgi:hypothetical protein